MHAYDYAILIAGTILWAIPFPLVRSRQKGALSLDRRARWGVALEFIGYTLLWQGSFWTGTLSSWQVSLAIVLFLAASLLSWTASRVLGRHLRVDAALESNHQLICAGPYRWMRHPIYTSMLCVLLATGILIASLYLFVPALLAFLIGTYIRVRVEDGLLASRFGDEFLAYRRRVGALIPGMKI